jgi:hypothetical protein
MTKFEGTWVNSGTSKGKSWHLSYSFTENKFDYFDHEGHTWSGTFIFTNTEITFSIPKFNSWTQSYLLDGNKLKISNTDNGPFGTFVKE